MGTYVSDFRQGDTKIIKVDFGNGVNITGWVFWFTLRKEFGDKNFVAQVTYNAGDNSMDDIFNGLAHITLDSDTSATIEPGKYYYDVQVSKGGTPPNIKTILPPIDDYKDRVTVVPGVTKVSS